MIVGWQWTVPVWGIQTSAGDYQLVLSEASASLGCIIMCVYLLLNFAISYSYVEC